MLDIDRSTLFLNFTVTILICIVFVLMLWYQHRNRYQGLFVLLLSHVLNLTSVALIFLRGTIGDFYSIILSNTLTMIAMFCMLLGLEKFLGVRLKHTLQYLFLLLFMLAQVYFTWIVPNMAARNVNVSIGHIVFCSSIVYLLFYRTPKSLRSLTREIGIVYFLFSLVNLVRFHDQLGHVDELNVQNSELMRLDLFILMLYQVFLIASGFVTTHMVNRRLKQDVQNDEKELKLSQNILKNLFVNLKSEYEDGRINLATQIDNNLNQSLASLRMNIGIIKKELSGAGKAVTPELISLVDEVYEQTGDTIERSVSLMNKVRNEMLYLYGIEEAIMLNIEEIQSQTVIICDYKIGTERLDLERKQSFTLFSLYEDVVVLLVNNGKTEKIEIELEKESEIVRLKITATGNNADLNTEVSDENSQIAVLKEKVQLANGTLSVKSLSDRESIITIEL